VEGLHDGGRAVGGEPFDGDHVAPVQVAQGEQAGSHGHPLDLARVGIGGRFSEENQAGAAVAFPAAFLGAGQAFLPAQIIEQHEAAAFLQFD